MRHTTLPVVLAVLAAAAPSRADTPEDDEDTYFAAFNKLTVAAGFGGHSGHVGGHAENGMGGKLELAYGRGRWQYTAEGSLETTVLQETEMTSTRGRRQRGALGVRWLARQFIPFDEMGVDMYLHAAGGLTSYRWMDDRSRRPDIDVGVGVGVRKLARHDVFMRIDLDLLFSRGDSGIAAGMVIGW